MHASLLQLFYEETGRLTKDPELINAVTIALSAMGFEYVDRTSQQAVTAYQRARDRWLQRRLTLINEAGTRIGTTLDTACTAQELADLGTTHFADLLAAALPPLGSPRRAGRGRCGGPRPPGFGHDGPSADRPHVGGHRYELLTHLDDVVIRLQRTEQRGMDEMSATCLYAVYDPVSVCVPWPVPHTFCRPW